MVYYLVSFGLTFYPEPIIEHNNVSRETFFNISEIKKKKNVFFSFDCIYYYSRYDLVQIILLKQ